MIVKRLHLCRKKRGEDILWSFDAGKINNLNHRHELLKRHVPLFLTETLMTHLSLKMTKCLLNMKHEKKQIDKEEG